MSDQVPVVVFQATLRADGGREFEEDDHPLVQVQRPGVLDRGIRRGVGEELASERSSHLQIEIQEGRVRRRRHELDDRGRGRVVRAEQGDSRLLLSDHDGQRVRFLRHRFFDGGAPAVLDVLDDDAAGFRRGERDRGQHGREDALVADARIRGGAGAISAAAGQEHAAPVVDRPARVVRGAGRQGGDAGGGFALVSRAADVGTRAGAAGRAAGQGSPAVVEGQSALVAEGCAGRRRDAGHGVAHVVATAGLSGGAGATAVEHVAALVRHPAALEVVGVAVVGRDAGGGGAHVLGADLAGGAGAAVERGPAVIPCIAALEVEGLAGHVGEADDRGALVIRAAALAGGAGAAIDGCSTVVRHHAALEVLRSAGRGGDTGAVALVVVATGLLAPAEPAVQQVSAGVGHHAALEPERVAVRGRDAADVLAGVGDRVVVADVVAVVRQVGVGVLAGVHGRVIADAVRAHAAGFGVAAGRSQREHRQGNQDRDELLHGNRTS